MTCECDVINYLYYNRNCDDEEIIDVALNMIKECLNHMQENANEIDLENTKVKIHNEIYFMVD